MTVLDTDNGWAGGRDQTIDDLPGSIWRRDRHLKYQHNKGPMNLPLTKRT